MKIIQGAVYRHMIVYNIPHRGGAEKILLTQTQSLALKVIIIRIKDL